MEMDDIKDDFSDTDWSVPYEIKAEINDQLLLQKKLC